MAENAIAVAAEGTVEFAQLSAKVELGPESADALGVPVGTVVDLGVLATTDTSKPSLWDRLRKLFAPEPLTDEQILAQRYQAFAARRVAEAS